MLYLQAFLRVLCEYTGDPVEKRRLQELCSKEGENFLICSRLCGFVQVNSHLVCTCICRFPLAKKTMKNAVTPAKLCVVESRQQA